MNKNAEKILKILSIAVTVTGLMHILFQKRKTGSTQAGQGKGNTNVAAGQGKGGGVNAEEEFKKFILKKKLLIAP